MTNREFFEAIINGTITEEVITHAHESIAKLDARNAKRAATPSKKAIENAPIIEAIKGTLTEEPITASEIAEKVGIKVQKASALCRQIVESGFASVTDVKVKGKGTVKGYFVEQSQKGLRLSLKTAFIRARGSMVKQSAVNRKIVGSIPTAPATKIIVFLL